MDNGSGKELKRKKEVLTKRENTKKK